MKLIKDRSLKTKLLTAVAIVGIGTSTGLFATSYHSNKRADANACALKSFLIVVAKRTQKSPQPGAEDVVKKYNRLIAILQPELKDCDPKFVIE